METTQMTWKIEHTNRNGFTSRAIVKGKDYADAKRRAAEIGFKPFADSKFFSIVLQVTEVA